MLEVPGADNFQEAFMLNLVLFAIDRLMSEAACDPASSKRRS
jgi:hypothetical protein